MDYADLAPGYRFPDSPMVLDQDAVARYRQAVGDDSLTDRLPDLAPPTAVAALALRAVLDHLKLTPGAVHASQGLSFHRRVSAGERLVHAATVAQNSVRGGWRWLGVDLETRDDQGQPVMTGRSTVLLPVDAGTEG